MKEIYAKLKPSPSQLLLSSRSVAALCFLAATAGSAFAQGVTRDRRQSNVAGSFEPPSCRVRDRKVEPRAEETS